MIRKCLFFLFVFVFSQINAQQTNLTLSHSANLIYEQEINASEIHSSFKPLIRSTVVKEVNIDSLHLLEFSNKWTTWHKRKLFSGETGSQPPP